MPPAASARPGARLELRMGIKTGGDLLSQAREGQVPSALWGLTALFGMGRGVSPTPKPPETVRDRVRAAPQGAPRGGPSKLHNPPTTGIKNISQALDPLVPVSYTH